MQLAVKTKKAQIELLEIELRELEQFKDLLASLVNDTRDIETTSKARKY